MQQAKLPADNGSMPGVMRYAIEKADRTRADHYIAQMNECTTYSKAWWQLRERAIVAAMPLLVDMRKRLPGASNEIDQELYMAGIAALVESLTPDQAGRMAYDAQKGKFSTYHFAFGAYVAMRMQHVRLSTSLSLSRQELDNILTKNDDLLSSRQRDYRALFFKRNIQSINPADDEDEARVQVLESAISAPDQCLQRFETVRDAARYFLEWSDKLDACLKRLAKDAQAIKDIEYFRCLTGYGDPQALPKNMSAVAKAFDVSRQAASKRVNRIRRLLGCELGLSSDHVNRIVQALVGYRMAMKGVSLAMVAQAKPAIIKPKSNAAKREARKKARIAA